MIVGCTNVNSSDVPVDESDFVQSFSVASALCLYGSLQLTCYSARCSRTSSLRRGRRYPLYINNHLPWCLTCKRSLLRHLIIYFTERSPHCVPRCWSHDSPYHSYSAPAPTCMTTSTLQERHMQCANPLASSSIYPPAWRECIACEGKCVGQMHLRAVNVVKPLLRRDGFVEVRDAVARSFRGGLDQPHDASRIEPAGRRSEQFRSSQRKSKQVRTPAGAGQSVVGLHLHE